MKVDRRILTSTNGTVGAQPEHRRMELDGESIARGDEACEVELKNAWPAARERPDVKTP